MLRPAAACCGLLLAGPLTSPASRARLAAASPTPAIAAQYHEGRPRHHRRDNRPRVVRPAIQVDLGARRGHPSGRRPQDQRRYSRAY